MTIMKNDEMFLEESINKNVKNTKLNYTILENTIFNYSNLFIITQICLISLFII